MKKNVIKMAVAAVCVVAAGMGGMKAYNAANQAETNMLLTENVEALSAGDGGIQCYGTHCVCYWINPPYSWIDGSRSQWP